MWWIAAMAALAGPAEPAAEEIVVYDQRALWDGTRFHLQSEQALSTGVLVGTFDGGSFRTPAWQFELVVACELQGRRRADCEIEDAAIRAATIDLWQRPSDIRRVNRILAEVRAGLLGRVVEVRFDRQGDLVRADVATAASEDHLMDVIDLATRVLGGVSMPPGEMEDDAVWFRPSDRLLRMPATVDSYQTAVVNHFGNELDGHYIVQTIGQARVAMELLAVGGRDLKGSDQDQPQNLRDFGDLGVQSARAWGEARLSAVASFDPRTGILEERVFSVAAGVPRPFTHTGSVRRLGDDEHPALGLNEQIAYPNSMRLSVPPWVSLQRIGLHEEAAW